MERTMSVEEKIRRAEEIYNRRRESEYKLTNTRVRVDNTKKEKNINKNLKKMIIQIIICITIYLIFYYIINNNYIFSEELRNKGEEILSYDISFSEMYQNISNIITEVQQKYQEKIEKIKQNGNEENNNEKDKEEETEQNVEEQNQENGEKNSEEEIEQNIDEMAIDQTNVNLDNNIGGSEEIIANEEKTIEKENLTEEEQMVKDAEDIKSKINFIKPLEGTITSVFGWRNPTSTKVSKYHTGIDIATKEGTNIISATNGKVLLASSTGAYGNHLKIQVEDIIIIYAHCLSLEVKEGEQINQGQFIAKVGSTGNSTGPHLHFEIRKEDRYVDPKLILDF